MSISVAATEINEDKMNAFLGSVVGDFGASLSAVLSYIGLRLGLYNALAEHGPLTAAELAERTSTTERRAVMCITILPPANILYCPSSGSP
jgi:hypothetical protein